jgi:hypothetical protein
MPAPFTAEPGFGPPQAVPFLFGCRTRQESTSTRERVLPMTAYCGCVSGRAVHQAITRATVPRRSVCATPLSSATAPASVGGCTVSAAMPGSRNRTLPSAESPRAWHEKTAWRSRGFRTLTRKRTAQPMGQLRGLGPTTVTELGATRTGVR